MKEQQQSDSVFSSRTLVFIAVVCTAAGIWLGLILYGSAPEPELTAMDLKAGTLLPRPKNLDDFSLVDQDGQPLDRDLLKGSWTFLAFGYTHCPDICPTMMATYDALEQELAESGSDAQPEFLFVSVDPERDTPQRVGEYVGYFNPRIRGATAGHDVLRPLTAQLGVLYQRAEEQDTAMGYMVDHSASMLLLDPEARLAAIFSAPHNTAEMAEDFRTISSHSGLKPSAISAK
jgi:protein SCO1/2